MPGMFGGGGMSAADIMGLAQAQNAMNRNNTWSPIYGGTEWSLTGSGGGAGVPGGGGGMIGQTYDPHTGQPTNGGTGPGIGAFNGDPNTIGQYTGAVPPSGPGGPGPGQWTETQTLSPFLQQRFDLAKQLQGRLAGDMQGFDPNTTNVTMDPNFEANQQQQAYGFAKSQLDPQWNTQEQQLKGQLAAQGLHPGDPGYQQQMNLFQASKNQAYNQAQMGSYQTGVQAGATRISTETQAMQAQIARQLAQSGWTMGQINALMAGMPGAPGGNGQGADLLGMGLQNSLAQQQMATSGANNLIGSGATIAGAAISDVNAKEDFADPAPAIEEFLQSAEPGEYSYKPEFSFAGEGRYVSPMAQGLERSQIGRQMVVETPVGKVVDYGKSFGAVLGTLSYLNRKLNSVMGL